MELQQGQIFTHTFVVTSQMSAIQVGSGLVDVLSTPAMIAQMEKFASQDIAKFLQPNEVTVGFDINVKHLLPSKIGTTIKCVTTVTQIVKNRIGLTIEVTENDKTVATATHTRVIVDKKRFIEGLK
ncbi:MAG: hypothetical protein KBS35_03105 [Mycoplasma sp.]|nr:hypothetical protein [Candidatus Hennigella equi]